MCTRNQVPVPRCVHQKLHPCAPLCAPRNYHRAPLCTHGNYVWSPRCVHRKPRRRAPLWTREPRQRAPSVRAGTMLVRHPMCTRNYVRSPSPQPTAHTKHVCGSPSVLTGTTSGHPTVCTRNYVRTHTNRYTHTHTPWAREPQVCTCQASPSGLLLGQGKPRFQVLSPCSPHRVLVSALLAAPTPETPLPTRGLGLLQACRAPRCVVSVRLFALCLTLVLRSLDGLDQFFGACDPWPEL